MFPYLWKIPVIDYTVRSYGFMLMIGFFSAAYIAAKRAEKVRANPDVVLNCAIMALIGSMIGARLFYVVHYWDTRFAHLPHPLWAIVDISAGGMELFGGILGAVILILGYLLIKRESVRLYFDILTPGLMWGIAFGRVGCFLNGCCWGGVCAGTMANAWGVTFPYGSGPFYQQYEDRLVEVPGPLLTTNLQGQTLPIPREELDADPQERTRYARALAEAEQRAAELSGGNPGSPGAQAAAREVDRLKPLALEEARHYRRVNEALASWPSQRFSGLKITPSELAALAERHRTMPVHPTQLYATINGFCGALFLSMLFRYRQRHGVVFAAWLLTYPWTRFLLEQIRVDNPKDTFGLTVSSALSLAMVLLGIGLWIGLQRLPLRSPAVKPWAPEAAE